MSRDEEITLFTIALLVVLTGFSFVLSCAGVYEPFVAMLLIDAVAVSLVGCYKLTYFVYRQMTNWYIHQKAKRALK